ncbi:hypothetical protein DUNSADRAFT_13942 [Dunaliella salina]|uniref:Uncharacterized protein n=1 Tax=Dunaliella salina TaxID=3046 RepID=A0ABQ7G8D3_DUNSA|nr:hypothetical protein DUNSADRAFT_13942 [Dunaliella salina]|eukprot:KAF5830862.1 hypothetical protein DUNSADRAFT_13942 [Dunaliella salina]
MTCDTSYVPTSYVSPCFHHFQNDNATRCLSKTQVALHLQKAYYEGLAAEAKAKEEGWDKHKAEMEDQLRGLKVRNMEAERLFKIQQKQLDDQLERTGEKLGKLEREHRDLRDASTEKLGKLRSDFGELQRHCDGLEHERQGLKRQLGDADVTAAARQAAEKKVGDLEDAIADMRQRTLRGMADVQRQKDEAEQSRDMFQKNLEGAQQRLEQEEGARKASDHQALLMRLDWQRMDAALKLERLINEPLRQTDHTTTTTSHVLSSYAAPVVAQRFRDPSAPRPSWPAPSSTAAAQPPYTGHGFGVVGAKSSSPPLEDPERAHHLGKLQKLAQAGVHASSFLVPELEYGNERNQGKHGRRQRPVQGSIPHDHRSNSQAPVGPLKHSDLTRLSRAWATTTPTAGFPHPQFLDNESRYRAAYKEAYNAGRNSRTGSRPRSQRLQKPSGAVKDAYHEIRARDLGGTAGLGLP